MRSGDDKASKLAVAKRFLVRSGLSGRVREA